MAERGKKGKTMNNLVNDRLTTSWLAGVAMAAAVLVPLRLGLFGQLTNGVDFSGSLGEFLLTAGVGYFMGVFVSLPLMICAALVLWRYGKHVEQATGLWTVSGALILTWVATLTIHLTPMADLLRSSLEMQLSIRDSFGFFLICTGTSALTFQVYDHAYPDKASTSRLPGGKLASA